MTYNRETLEKSQVKFNIEFTQEEWSKIIDETYNKTKNKYTIEGFRKGKVPKSMLIKLYGIGIFFEDGVDIAINRAYSEIMTKETDLNPVAQPDFSVEVISDSELKLACVITVMPTFELAKYTGRTLNKIEATVNEDEVDAEVIKAQEKLAVFETVEGRAVESGDQVVIDFSGSLDGVMFDGGTAEKFELIIGSNSFIPGFEDQLIGMNIGEDKDINVTFPANYNAENLAGKDVVFAIKLHEIKNKILPEINDEFAKDVSEFNTLDEYKESIRSGMKYVAERNAKEKMETVIIEAVANDCVIDIPEVMITNMVDDMVQEFEYKLMYQGMKVEDYYKYTGSSKDQLAAQYTDVAAKRVRMQLVMGAIIKTESIKVEDIEIDAKLETYAVQAEKSLEEYKKSMNSKQIDYIVQDIVMTKLFDFLFENNKFV